MGILLAYIAPSKIASRSKRIQHPHLYADWGHVTEESSAEDGIAVRKLVD